LLILASAGGYTQTEPPPAAPKLETKNDFLLTPQDLEKTHWANAKPYLDDPLPELRSAVPELKGLDPAPGQEQLTSILDRTGEKCVDLLRHMPNVISREEVTTQTPRGKRQSRTFEYLLVSHQTPSGTELEEYRTVHGRPALMADEFSQGQVSKGFVTDWRRLAPGNRSQSRFRYLGQQEVDKHKTFVVAFAEIPGEVKTPATFLFFGTWISMLFQGVVWIDSTNFQIVRLREDILAPRPDAFLKKFTSKIQFADVEIPDAGLSLWLPQDVDIKWEFNGRAFQRIHHYSKFRLYAAKTRILPAEP